MEHLITLLISWFMLSIPLGMAVGRVLAGRSEEMEYGPQ